MMNQLGRRRPEEADGQPPRGPQVNLSLLRAWVNIRGFSWEIMEDQRTVEQVTLL